MLKDHSADECMRAEAMVKKNCLSSSLDSMVTLLAFTCHYSTKGVVCSIQGTFRGSVQALSLRAQLDSGIAISR